MNYENICSIKYFPDFNKVNTWSKEGVAFINENRPELFRKCLDIFLEKIIPSNKEEDIHLGYFYANSGFLKFIDEKEPLIVGLTLLIFPSKGKIKKYVLNRK